MAHESKPLDTAESIQIITSMINQAKGNVRKNSFHFLLWGWVVVMANLGMYALSNFTEYQYPYAIWLITIPAWVISFIYGYRQDRSSQMRTPINSVNKWLWISFGVSTIVIIFFGRHVNYNINPIILTWAALPTVVSGLLLKFKPLVIGGASFWGFAILAFIVPYETQGLVGAAAITCGYLIPGHLLRKHQNNG